MLRWTRFEGGRAGWPGVKALAVGALAVVLLIPACGKQKKKSSKPGGYFDSLAGAKDMGEETACRVQLAGLGQALTTYAASNDGRFPPVLEKLVEMGVVPRDNLTCPKRSGQSYVYLPGQSQGMPADNILVFEAEPAHRGRCNVLRLSGAVEALTPEQLAAGRAKTQQAIRAAGGP